MGDIDMIALFDSIDPINSKHRKTLRAVFAKPTSSSVVFSDIESLLMALGVWCTNEKARASRSCLKMSNGAVIAHILAKRPSGTKWKKCASC